MKQFFRRFAAAFCAFALCLTSASALSVEQAVDLLEANYVDDLPAAAYDAATLDELFDAVGDPYTYYMSATDYEEFTAGVESETSVTGIGAGVEFTANGIRISSILPGSGAEAAGLAVDDCIIAINGESCVPANDGHRNLIIGEEGTYVTLTVRHENGTTQDYRIERRTIAIHNTSVTFADGVATIDCDSFGTQTLNYFSDGVSQWKDDARFWIVDLRGNSGGISDAAAGALGLFTGSGPKIFFQAKDSSASYYTAYLLDQMTDLPVIVLVNERSASASEIVAGGIRAEKAGVVIGPRTYGKGVAQRVFDKTSHPDLFDGDSLKVTAYRFYSSDGNTTDKIGVLPTLYIDDEYVPAVAKLLTAEKPKSDNYLHLMLNGHSFYVDLTEARKKSNIDAFAELLGALPPDAGVGFVVDGTELALNPELAIRRLGLSANSRAFADVSSSLYETEINTLAAYRILGGDGAGHFFPDRTLTRAELCAMLAQTLNVTGSATGLYKDVPADSWFSGCVGAVTGLGFMGGVGDGYFDPNAPLTQEQFIAVMGRLARFLNFNAEGYALNLTDGALSAKALEPFAPWARVEASVLTGYDGNMLYAELSAITPKAPVTREQAAATLCRVLKTLNLLAY